MNLGVNKGTKIRTILRIAASLQRAIALSTAAISAFTDQYNLTILALIWMIFTLICDFVVDFLTTYYNNDYTPEAEVGTLTTRDMKEKRLWTVENYQEPDDAEVIEDDD